MAFMDDEKYMDRCIQLALNGKGNTSPNPMVGCVIVHNNTIIGEGYHRKAGEPHAEVNAINNVSNKELLKESILYVNLEPCAHFGKTPPCANLIIDLKIPNVVIGTTDTAAHVSGKGIELLRKAGCNVKVGVLENESRELNKRFFTFHEKKRPYAILKWAETQDGFIDINKEFKNEATPTWITNNLSKSMVHKWRAEEDAILIGTNTVISDNPGLTTREWFGKNPLRIIFDQELKLSPTYNVFSENAETLIIADYINRNKNISYSNNKIGIEFVNYSIDFLNQLNTIFVKYKLQSIIIEGGSKTLQYFIDNDNWDEARVFIGDKIFKTGVKAPEINKIPVVQEKLGNSKLYLFYNK